MSNLARHCSVLKLCDVISERHAIKEDTIINVLRIKEGLLLNVTESKVVGLKKVAGGYIMKLDESANMSYNIDITAAIRSKNLYLQDGRWHYNYNIDDGYDDDYDGCGS